MKKCQFCNEEIQDSAQKCRYCGEWLEEASKSNRGDIKKNGVAQEDSPRVFNFAKVYGLTTLSLTVIFSVIYWLLDRGNSHTEVISLVFGSFIFALLVGVLVTYAIRGVFYGSQSDHELSKDEIERYSGLKNGLLLVILGLSLGLLINIAYFLFGIYEVFTGSVDFSATLQLAIIQSIFIVTQGYLIYLFFKKSILFPKYFIIFTLVVLMINIIPLIFAQSSPDQSDSSQAGRSILSAIIWIPYMLLSKRVKATFRAKSTLTSKASKNIQLGILIFIAVALLISVSSVIVDDHNRMGSTQGTLIEQNQDFKENRTVEVTKQIDKEIQIGEEFSLTNGRKLTITEVTVGNYYTEPKIFPDLMRAQVAIRINSDNGPLNEADYNKMYITQGNQLIKLSNSGGAYWGQYWFEMPKTNNFDNMKLHFGQEATVILAPYIRNNNL